VARDAFLDSLNDPKMRIRILEKDAKTIEEAYASAARYEAYLAGSLSSDDGDRRRVRAVNSRADGDRNAQRRLDATVEKLQGSLGSLMQSLAQHQQTVAPPGPPPMASTWMWQSPMPPAAGAPLSFGPPQQSSVADTLPAAAARTLSSVAGPSSKMQR
jgi:hypothetical protein